MYDGKTPSIVTDANTPLVSGGATFSITRFATNTPNAPNTGAGILLTWSSSERYGAQIEFNNSGFYYRSNNNSSISSWEKIST